MGTKYYAYLDSDTQIFIKEYQGDITLEDLLSSWIEIIRKGTIPKSVKKFLVSYQNATVCMPTHAAVEIAKFYRQQADVFENSKVAMLMEKPEQVVYPNLVMHQPINFTVNVFSTREAAIRWLIGD